MTDPASLPITRIAWRGAVRIIRSIFPPIDLFEDIADPADWPLLIAAEQKTNPRLMETIGNLDLVPPDRRVSGAGASWLMAPFTHVARVTVPAMAVNHGVSIVYANYSGTEGDLTYVGQSLIADPYGEVVAQAGTGPALLVADLPLTWDEGRLSTQARDLRLL